MIYAFDRRWWKEYNDQVPKCEKWCGDKWSSVEYDLRYIKVENGNGLSTNQNILHSGKNSGYQAINLAYHLGAKNIYLIGYDMKSGGEHWHGKHPKNWGNSEGANKWARLFNDLAKDLEEKQVNVINCTIDTAITCFKQGALDEL